MQNDLKGRLDAINAMLSLGVKMGCDVSEEASMAAQLYVPLSPNR